MCTLEVTKVKKEVHFIVAIAFTRKYVIETNHARSSIHCFDGAFGLSDGDSSAEEGEDAYGYILEHVVCHANLEYISNDVSNPILTC